MVFFNDPSVRRRAVTGDPDGRRDAHRSRPGRDWAASGHQLALGIGIAQGYATLGRIGFEGRYDYAAIGSVTNLAARLCAEASPGRCWSTERVFTAAGAIAVGEDAGIRELRGFSRSIHTFEVKGIDNARVVS